MAIDPSSAAGNLRGVGRSIGPAGGREGRMDGKDSPSFSDSLKEALGDVSRLQDDARSHIQSFLRGEPVEVHQVMAAAEEAGIALEMLIEVRNKLTEAYRSVINMQA